MFCSACQAALASDEEYCPSCGEGVRRASAADGVVLVEVAAAPDAERVPVTAVVVRAVDGHAVTPLARAARLPALAWRQPGVRAAVTTGASAVALSLALRAARMLLATRRPTRQPSSSSMLPALTELLRTRAQAPAPGPYARGQSQERLVSETIIYIRHSVRG